MKLADMIDFERVNSLLEGFNKATGFVTAILDLEGHVLSQSGWREICMDFHRVHPTTSGRCTESDTCLTGLFRTIDKFHSYQCPNGLVEVAVPIVIQNEHVGNLVTGQLFFKKPDMAFFRKQASTYRFDEASYLKAVKAVPVIPEKEVTRTMDFLLNMTELISEMTLRRMEQTELVSLLRKSENEMIKALDKATSSENKLRESEGFLKDTQKIAGLGTYTLDVPSGIWTSSEVLDEIFGIDGNFDKSVNGWVEIIHPEFQKSMNDYFIQEVIGKRVRFDREYKIIRQNDRDERWVHGMGDLFFDDNHQPEKMIGTIRDITKLKQEAQEMIKAREKAEESDRLKSAFLANMSHEICTPMNGILGFARLLEEPGLTGDQQLEYLRSIEKSGARMLNIINEIIDISKIESGQMNVDLKSTDINKLVESVYTNFAAEVESLGMSLVITNILPGEEIRVVTDMEKLSAILTNLVRNAIKYSEEGTIGIGYEKKGGFIEFFVQDSGIGIPKERQSAIFERFVQADISDIQARQGAGLGLTISKSYVGMLGGQIRVESEEGKGSIFYFTIPYAAHTENEPVKDGASNGNKIQKKNLKILIAEDNELSGLLLSLQVKSFGEKIIIVNSGTEAIKTCRSNPDIDLILMDIQMPVMGGYEAIQQIRQFNQEVIIIAQTAYGLVGEREKILEAGCNDYITKPINVKELKGLIHQYFD